MKKLILISVLGMSSFIYATPNQLETTTDRIESSTDDVQYKITTARLDLAARGYSHEMMNDLFGDENFYFPKNNEELDLLIYIVDLLIENEQYEEKDKTVLINLATDAYAAFRGESVVEARTTVLSK